MVSLRSSFGSAVCAACAVMALALSPASPVAAQGMLIPTDESITPLELRQHEVEFEIADNGAITHVTQVFANHTSTQLEATYYFAVPPGSVTTDFALWMNGERIQGEVLPRDQARQTYENIVRRMRDPGLLEYVDGELFQASIFPVPANGTQRVEIEFANVLGREGELLHYRYPLHESASARIPQFIVRGEIRSRNAITSVYSPYHAIEETIASDGRSARVGMEENGASVENDFELFIGQTGDDVGFSLLTHEPDNGEDGYFMLTIAPSPELEDLEVLPKQVTFVVDTSGSMAGDKIDQAREMLRYCVENLRSEDTFQIVSFSSGVRTAFTEPVSASRENRRDAQAFIDGLQARGNTNISGALERALRDPSSSDRPHSILFVTDGLPTEGETNVEDIVAVVRQGVSDGDRRVFSFGVGYDVNARLLDSMARRGRGEAGYVRPNEDMSDIVGEFYDSIGAPLLTQIDLDFGGVRVSEVYPNPLPDLYRDRDITVFGRYRADHSSSLVVRGQAAGNTWVQEFGAVFDPMAGADTAFVGNLWAHRRVDDLLTEMEEQGESRRLIDEVVELASAWGIVTPYTSYLAVDPNEQIMPPQPLVVDDMMRPPRPTPRPIPRPSAPDADGFGVGTRTGGSTGFGSAMDEAEQGAPVAAARPTAEPMRMRREDSGREAVEDSIARAENRNQMVVSGPRSATRRAAGRDFTITGGMWLDAAASGRAVDERVIYLSDRYFELLRENPELSAVFAFGDRVRFVLDGRVIEVAP